MSNGKIFYAIPEYFPPWRLDVGHLFGEQLDHRCGMAVTWSMWRDKPGPSEVALWQGQRVYLPQSFGREGRRARLLSRAAHALAEGPLFLRLLWGQRFDVIQARDVRYMSALLGWLTARLRGAKFVYWLSYPFPEHYLAWSRACRGPARLVRWMQGAISFLFVYKWLMRRADHVFVQSEQMKRDVCAYGVAPEKMTAVPMGVPPALLDWRERNPVAVTPGRVVYVGTFARVRRLETLLEAFARVVRHVPHATLMMVGEGDVPAERAFLEQEAARLGIAAQVRFTGFVPMTEAWRHAASAQVCVSPFYPSFELRSTSPTKLNEYFALGRPVVANDHPEQSAAIAESGAGLCVPWGVDSFADAIRWLLEHPAEAETMARRGPVWAGENRGYDRIADGVMAQYRKLLGGYDPARAEK